MAAAAAAGCRSQRRLLREPSEEWAQASACAVLTATFRYRPRRGGSQLGITFLGKGSGPPDKVAEIRGLFKKRALKKKQALHFSRVTDFTFRGVRGGSPTDRGCSGENYMLKLNCF